MPSAGIAGAVEKTFLGSGPKNMRQKLPFWVVVEDAVDGVGPVRIISERPSPATNPWLERLLGPGACKGKILLVDDNVDARVLFQHFLEKHQYFVRPAENGVECLKLARTMRPDLILLNYLMPVMDGLTALRQLRKDPTISYLKVVVFSAVGSDHWFWAAAREEGALDCLETPFGPKTLLDAVERALRR